MGSSPKAPPPRSYQAEMFEALRAQAAIMPELMALEKRYIPELQKMQQTSLRAQMDFLNEEARRRTGQFGARANEWVKSLTPAMVSAAEGTRQASLAGIGKESSQALTLMGQQANELLARDGAMTDKQRFLAEDAGRRAAAARGLNTSNQGLALEIMSSEQMERNNRNDARDYASKVATMNQTLAAQGGSLYGTTFNAGLQAYNPLSMMSTASGFNQKLGPEYFQPESNYNAQLIGMNNKIAFDASAGDAAGKNSMIGAGIGFAGAVI